MSDQAKHSLVMLIDDNELDNFINQKLIQNENFASRIIMFQSAQAALDHLKNKTSTPDEIPNLIFLDIMMPGMDGFGFLDEFEKLSEGVKAKCRIVMLSTTESFGDLNRANQNKHVSKFLNKPLTVPVLKALRV